MMHATDEQLLAFEDGELTPRQRGDVMGHLGDCSSCTTRLDYWRRHELRTIVLLSALDHRRPTVSAHAVVARARAAPVTTWGPLIAAGVALIVLASAATAAVPGSALRQYLERVFAANPVAVSPRLPETPVVPPRPRQAGASGIAFLPESAIEVVFLHAQAAGAIRITLTDSPSVRLEHDAGDAAYALTERGVVVDNTGSRASYVLMLPRAGPQAIVRIGNRTVFARTSDRRIATTATRDSSGSYVLAFTHSNRREP